MTTTPQKTLNDWLNEGRIQSSDLVDIFSKNAHLRSLLGPAPYFNRRLKCADGFTISVQAGSIFGCQPHINVQDVAEYTAFEIGCPNADDPLLVEVMESDGILKYVPRHLIEQLVATHGGIIGYDDEYGRQG